MSFADFVFHVFINCGDKATATKKPARKPKYINSGVGFKKELNRGKLDFEFLYNPKGDSAQDYFRQGEKFNPTHLNMPANCLDQGPHYHPVENLHMLLRVNILMVTWKEMLLEHILLVQLFFIEKVQHTDH